MLPYVVPSDVEEATLGLDVGVGVLVGVGVGVLDAIGVGVGVLDTRGVGVGAIGVGVGAIGVGVGVAGRPPPPLHVDPAGHATQFVGRREPLGQYNPVMQVHTPLQFALVCGVVDPYRPIPQGDDAAAPVPQYVPRVLHGRCGAAPPAQ
jgi:hypothetical protein